MYPKNKIIIIAGHYGAGKTNVACETAVKIKEASPEKKVTIVDLDTVNPYFRTADSAEELRSLGIRTIIPQYANTNVDLPTLPPEIYSVFLTDETVVFDVGGDDGAVALGVYEREIKSAGYDMLYVINMYRPLTSTPEEAVSVMREIEEYSKLRFTGIVNNSNLGDETTKDIIKSSKEYAETTARLAELPLIFTTAVGEENLPECINNPLIMKNYTKRFF